MKGHRAERQIVARSCPHCGEPYDVSEHVAEESPFCSMCLPDRVAMREREVGSASVVESGDYLFVMPLPPGTPGSMPS